MKKATTPWFALDCAYNNNPKIFEVGPAAAFCHMYLLAKGPSKSGRPDGAMSMDEWSVKKIRRWLGVFKNLFSDNEILVGMNRTTEELLALVVTVDGQRMIKPSGYEEFFLYKKRAQNNLRKQRQRARERGVSCHENKEVSRVEKEENSDCSITDPCSQTISDEELVKREIEIFQKTFENGEDFTLGELQRLQEDAQIEGLELPQKVIDWIYVISTAPKPLCSIEDGVIFEIMFHDRNTAVGFWEISRGTR